MSEAKILTGARQALAFARGELARAECLSMSRELECAYEDLDRLEAQLDLALQIIQQYRAEIHRREDLVQEGFCQSAWFEDTYENLNQSRIDGTLPKEPA